MEKPDFKRFDISLWISEDFLNSETKDRLADIIQDIFVNDDPSSSLVQLSSITIIRKRDFLNRFAEHLRNLKKPTIIILSFGSAEIVNQGKRGGFGIFQKILWMIENMAGSLHGLLLTGTLPFLKSPKDGQNFLDIAIFHNNLIDRAIRTCIETRNPKFENFKFVFSHLALSDEKDFLREDLFEQDGFTLNKKGFETLFASLRFDVTLFARELFEKYQNWDLYLENLTTHGNAIPCLDLNTLVTQLEIDISESENESEMPVLDIAETDFN